MAASLTPNREAALAAMWWLFEGATVYTFLADTSGVATPPALTDPYEDWLLYALNSEYDLFLTGGTVAYDATIADRAELPQLEIVLDYLTDVTYTDVLVFAIPATDAGAGAPAYSMPFIGVIHESSPVTLSGGSTKTYRLDLFSEWI